ncbi:MAG: Rieske (2Fe-2S) domain protein [Chthonomonadales bacterium]|nr:Rieske (2Fe-2S) domain protein [Chthonomonadales bacterium]
MNSEVIMNKIGEQEWLEPIETGLQKSVERTFRAGGEIGTKAENFLHGTWLGHPLHPAVTDVPLGAWTVAAVLDISDAVQGDDHFARAADAAVGIGLVGAAAAAVSGFTDWHKTEGRSRRVGIVHGILNLTATALYATSWVLRKRRDRDAARIFGWLGFGVAGAAAYLGGELVFSEKIGVDHADRTPLTDGFVSAMREADLAENTPQLVEVGGVKVVLVRQNGKIFALQNTCSHLGGPLAEGKVEGDTIRCPWHGSCFALEDGKVQEGPATYPQPTYEVRINKDHIELRGASVPAIAA